MPLLLVNRLSRNRESVGITDIEIAVHVIAGSNTGSGFLAGLEGVAGIDRDPTRIYNAYRIQHWTAVFIEQHVFANRISNDLQADALRLQGGRIGLVVKTFNRAVVHEIQLDITNAPVVTQNPVGLA